MSNLGCRTTAAKKNTSAGARATIPFSILLPLIFLFPSCTQKHHHITPSIYYWKTGYNLSNFEQRMLQSAGCRRIFLHSFDVAIDEASGLPTPRGIVRLQQPLDTAFQYVPVVFITQEVLAKFQPPTVLQLAVPIGNLLADICTKNNWQPDEIQIDCDWTAGTKETYFSLLRALRKQPIFKNKQLSCTIRLHQVKYKLACGIPPADRGLVMCYNMGDLRKPGIRNSILDPKLAEVYLKHLDQYPLPVDIALPLFRWCVQFRGGKLKGILRDVSPGDVERSALFRVRQGNLYRCLADTIWRGYLFRRDDELRLETPSLQDIQSIADYTAQRVQNDSLRVILFHADSLTLSKYSPHDLAALYHAYR